MTAGGAGRAAEAAAAGPRRRPPPLPDRPVVRRPDDVGSEPGDAGRHARAARVRARLARRHRAGSAAPRPPGPRAADRHTGRATPRPTPLLQRAYDIAEAAHPGQFRKSGDPYITHPLAVATILAELGMDTTTLVAALLHDTVEDTGYTLEESAPTSAPRSPTWSTA